MTKDNIQQDYSKQHIIATSMVNPDKIYVRKMKGFFQRLRSYTLTILFGLFFFMEWATWDGRQAILFDLPARQFHIFGITFWPQDLTLLALLLIVMAFILFAVTNFAGRLWCGFTCPQTAWTFVFMWIEERIEGSRNKRIMLDNKPWDFDKIWRKTLKHFLWLLVGLATGITFVAYFYPVRELLPDLLVGNVGPWPLFWILFFTSTTYGAAGILREQVCFFWCPYARFQAVMFDIDTLLVSYNSKRGEGKNGRGKRKKDDDREALGLGDCIDCEICVQVCPTGIDIRDGIQYQCIDCGLCVDACNEVMDKMGYEPDLISYTTEKNLAGEKTKIIRPRLFGYSFMVLIMVGALLYSLVNRTNIELDVIRDRSVLYQLDDDGMLENSYILKVLNKSQAAATYQLTVSGIDNMVLKGAQQFELQAGEIGTLPIMVELPLTSMDRPNMDITFIVTDEKTQYSIEKKSRFIGPIK